MCLALPGKLIDIAAQPESGPHRGRVSFDGVIKTIDLSFTPEARPGDYLIVHAGFAISVLDEDEAQASLALFRQWAQQTADGGDATP